MNENLKFWNNSFWFSVDEIVEQFQATENVVLNCFNAVCHAGELDEKEVSAKNKENILFLNLDAVISIAYRIDNVKATKFRNVGSGANYLHY